MGKKMKIAYFAVIALNLIACVINVIRGDYSCVILSGISILWLCVCYGLSAQIDKAHALLAESFTREKIAYWSFDFMWLRKIFYFEVERIDKDLWTQET